MKNLGLVVAILLLGRLTSGQVTERVSANPSAGPHYTGGDLSWPSRVVSGDGRFVVFFSATNMVPADTNGQWDVYVRDRLEGTTELVSRAAGGTVGNGTSGLYGISISIDGRFVAFESVANNLVPGDINGVSDIFVRDRLTRTTERVSVDSNGGYVHDESLAPSISADGRYVVFHSASSDLVPGDTNSAWDVFVHDRQSGRTERVSVGTGGIQGNSDSTTGPISPDGRFVVFSSEATNLVPGDTNLRNDVFLRDRHTGITERISVATDGTQGNGDSVWASLSNDGRFVAFTSEASNLVPGDTNGSRDAFVRDRWLGTTERVDVANGGAQGNHGGQDASISGDGRFVAFYSGSTNLIASDTHGGDIFVRDRRNGTTERVSVTTGGSLTTTGYSDEPSISEDGRYVVFRSSAPDLVPGDTNGMTDVFLHDRLSAGFTSLCDAGASGVIDCPCSNPSSGPGRGCDNSSSTGGAVLSAAGIAYLSIDGLVFTTSGENSTSLSFLVQGDAALSSGAVYGQGVRCLGGSLLRLFVKQANAGSIRAPDFGAGDPTISARSASKGDVIQPGRSRWYLVYYRDPVVLGACPASSTFNTTQTGRVTWWP